MHSSFAEGPDGRGDGRQKRGEGTVREQALKPGAGKGSSLCRQVSNSHSKTPTAKGKGLLFGFDSFPDRGEQTLHGPRARNWSGRVRSGRRALQGPAAVDSPLQELPHPSQACTPTPGQCPQGC